MKAEVIICNICYAEGKVRMAISRYWNDHDNEFNCCSTHLRQVKEAGLKNEELGDEQLQAFE